MTGGTIPALIWHNVMAYAHQGIELRQLPGLPPPQKAPAGDAAAQGASVARPILLTRKATAALVQVERLLDDAARALPPVGVPPGPLGALDRQSDVSTQTAAREQLSTPTRGN
jgi:penicillin-binding protein 1A